MTLSNISNLALTRTPRRKYNNRKVVQGTPALSIHKFAPRPLIAHRLSKVEYYLSIRPLLRLRGFFPLAFLSTFISFLTLYLKGGLESSAPGSTLPSRRCTVQIYCMVLLVSVPLKDGLNSLELHAASLTNL